MHASDHIALLEQGIVYPPQAALLATDILNDGILRGNPRAALDELRRDYPEFAMDAQPTTVTAANIRRYLRSPLKC